jgi:uncharacterized protein (TIGR02271 family)
MNIVNDNSDQQGVLPNSNQSMNSSKVIPVVEEHLHIGTEIIETGKVHISKKVIEEPYDAELPVFKEEVIVEKKTINEYIDGEVPGIRLDGETTIIPVVKEVIIKRLLLVEEIHITKRKTENTVSVHETLRKEEVTIERTHTENTNNQPNS